MNWNGLWKRFLNTLGISRTAVVRAYDGYGDADDVIVQGHVLAMSPLPRKKYRHNFWINLFSLIRLFIIVPLKNARVEVVWNGETRQTYTNEDGFFKLEWKPMSVPAPGWHKAQVTYISGGAQPLQLAKAECDIFIPHAHQYIFVSDIDDTFLISHSANLRKRLYLLFSKNARSRKAFDGVAEHYRLLAGASLLSEDPNPFFYVSSSEWNLYNYIREFCRKEQLPRGIFLLSNIRQLKDLLKTGQGKHSAKYIRIARILKSYPHRKYVLMGDNSQEDPFIYRKIVQDFPRLVHAVYIRNIRKSRQGVSEEAINFIRKKGVHCCLFMHSEEAIAHSRSIGLAGNIPA